MILVHLIAGMVSGMISAVMLWLFDYPLWLMLLSYPIAGGLGLFASARRTHRIILAGVLSSCQQSPADIGMQR